jgi:SAM-dependent methyltransferase
VDEYARVNREFWDERAPAHAASAGYAVARFAQDREFLSEVVRFDRPRLGDIEGLEGVHLQCHIGTDTVSLGRLGARMTGLDISPPALDEARRLAEAAGVEATFVESEVYAAVDVLGAERFDLVYTGVGALCWLPDVRRWAEVVADLLRPGGRLHIREGHPVLWSLAEGREDGLLVLEYPYVETAQAIVWDEGEEGTTYVETDVVFQKNVTHEWNHGLGQIITALLDAGMELTLFEEHDTVPWDALPGQMTDTGGGEMRLTERPERLPHTYTIGARKR